MNTTKHLRHPRARGRNASLWSLGALLVLAACGTTETADPDGPPIEPIPAAATELAPPITVNRAAADATDDLSGDTADDTAAATDRVDLDTATQRVPTPRVETADATEVVSPDAESDTADDGDDTAGTASDDAPAATPDSTVPEAQDPEPTSTEPVAITDNGVSSAPPQPTPSPAPTPLAPAWESITLDLVEPPAPPAPPTPQPDPPTPLDQTTGNSGGSLGELTSNAVGCASDCIVSAQLVPHPIHATFELSVETSVQTLAYLWIDTVAPPMSNGTPVPGAWPDHANASMAHDWSADVSELDHDTTYHATLLVVDQYGNENWATGSATTVAGAPDELVAAGSPCTFQCIEDGFIYPGEDHTTVDIVLLANTTMASYSINVSTSEPGWIGDSPILPADIAFTETQGGAGNDAVRGTLNGLAPDTLYHVVAKVTDSDGATSHAIGSFRSAPLPPPPPEPTDVLISFQQIHVKSDGDPSIGNRGELAFDWGWQRPDGSLTAWSRSEEKIHSNTVVDISGGSAWVSVAPGGTIPQLVVNAIERDYEATFPSEQCFIGNVFLATTPRYFDDCDIRVTPGLLEPVSVDWIRAQPLCGNFGFHDHRADHHCVAFSSMNNGEQYATFDAVVSFDIQD